LTSEAEWVIGVPQGEAMSYRAIDARPQSFRGSSWTEPVMVGHDVIFVQAQGNVIRALTFAQNQDSYAAAEISVYSSHLLEPGTVERMAYSQVPWSTIWMVRTDGRVLSLTYLRDEEIFAWAEHIFLNVDGSEAHVEDVCTVMEDSEEVVWLIVNRAGVRRIERMAKRQLSDATDACILDCATVYDGSGFPVTTISVPQFAEGDVVTVWADGIKLSATVTAEQTVVLATAASKITVGISITAELVTMPSPQTITMSKQVPRVWVETDSAEWTWNDATVGISAVSEGSTFDKRPVQGVVDGLLEILINTSTNPGGCVTLRVTDPIPVEIRGIVRDVVAGP
jgi:hypothetical protein